MSSAAAFVAIGLYALLPLGAHAALLCSESPCLNGGTCVPTTPGGDQLDHCDCTSGWFGDYCQAQPCQPNPCQNGGVCTEIIETAGYSCECAAGFNGHECQYHPCDPEPCVHGTCEVFRDPRQRECHCDNGWHGRNCDLEVPSVCPCLNGGRCGFHHEDKQNMQGTYHVCMCQPGFCGTICNITDACENGGVCVNRMYMTGGYCCDCPDTHDGQRCERDSVCEDPGYCLNGGVCNPKWRSCLNHTGWTDTSWCVCDTPHWIGNRCEIRNPCQDEPCFALGTARCVGRTETAYTCVCHRQWGGTICDEEYAAHCSVYDDPHMFTFDGSYYEHHSDCRVVAAKTCSNSWPAQRIPTIQVMMENRKVTYGPNGGQVGGWGVTLVDTIQLEIYETDIRIHKSTGVQVDLRDGNGFVQVASLPWPTDATNPPLPTQTPYPIFITADPADPLGRLNIKFTADSTKFMYVYFGRGTIGIYLSHVLATLVKGKMCGACGFFDYEKTNDFAGQASPNEAFTSGQLQRPIVPPGCTPILDPFHTVRKKRTVDKADHSHVKRQATQDFCVDEAARAAAQETCAIINDQDGPFGHCYETNRFRAQMFAGCVNDICVNTTFLEVNLAGYAAYCGRYGENGDWRELLGFPMKCLKNQHYSTCMSRSCMPTSDSLEPCPDIPGANLLTECEEGCVCDDPLIWDQISASCIRPEDIGTTKFGFPRGFELFDGLYDSIFTRCDERSEDDPPTCRKGGYCFEVGAVLTHEECGSYCTCIGPEAEDGDEGFHGAAGRSSSKKSKSKKCKSSESGSSSSDSGSSSSDSGSSSSESGSDCEEVRWVCGQYDESKSGSDEHLNSEEREDLEELCHECHGSSGGDCSQLVYPDYLECLHVLKDLGKGKGKGIGELAGLLEEGGVETLVDSFVGARGGKSKEKQKSPVEKFLLIEQSSKHVLDVCPPLHAGTDLPLDDERYSFDRCAAGDVDEPACRKEGYCFAIGSKIASQDCDKVCECESARGGRATKWKCRGGGSGSSSSSSGSDEGFRGGGRGGGGGRGRGRGGNELKKCRRCRDSASACDGLRFVEAMADCLAPRHPRDAFNYGKALLHQSPFSPQLYDFCQREEQAQEDDDK